MKKLITILKKLKSWEVDNVEELKIVKKYWELQKLNWKKIESRIYNTENLSQKFWKI